MKTIKRAWLLYQIRSLEISVDDMADAIEAVADPLLRQQISISRALACRELARVRAEYSALLPVGRRVVWRAA